MRTFGSADTNPSMIRIHILEGKAFVWNCADARRIREEHRIVGSLVGALARKPRQNDPSVLKEVAVYQKELEESYWEQLKLATEQRKITLDTLAERIAQGRAKKKRQKGEKEAPPSKPADSNSDIVFPRESMMIQLATERKRPGQAEVVDWRVPSPDWPYAGQQDHETRYCIFKSLWEQGYYVTSGGKFGGDFLVYPGDPMRFHAHYVAICTSKEEPFSLCDIISAGRLGTNVKKTVLLCSVDQDGTAVFTSLQWSGMQ
ncbi:hypothetical protein lerEdw1_009385 [Lerista edwardsae]|nr:hypothetical protein lerEdw1_009385 [Lerista edwardsae]